MLKSEPVASLKPFIESLDKTANFKAQVLLRHGALDVRVYLCSYVIFLKPVGEFRCARQEYLSIPWPAIRSMKYKPPEAPSADVKGAELKIRLKNRRAYRLIFGEKEPTQLNNIVKNFKACHEYFSNPQFFFCFEAYKHMKGLEETYHGWQIYDLKADFAMQGLDLRTKDVG
jgi:hypothetical protein